MKTLHRLAAAAAFSLALPAWAATTVGNGAYYSVPSWSQTLAPTTRFLVLANFNQEAVLDRETGLVWQRSTLPGIYSFGEAEVQCFASRVGGRMGWRLPSIQELTSLFDPAATAAPFLPAGHPFSVPNVFAIFSRSARALDSFDLFFAVGSAGSTSLNVVPLPNNLGFGQAWCVRGGT